MVCVCVCVCVCVRERERERERDVECKISHTVANASYNTLTRLNTTEGLYPQSVSHRQRQTDLVQLSLFHHPMCPADGDLVP